MKKLLFIALSLPLFGQSYPQIISKVDNALTLQRANQLLQATKEMEKAAQGKNLPTLEASLEAIYLHQTPTMYLHLPSTPVMGLPMGKKERYQGELYLSYPLFSGFAISAAIDKAKLKTEKAKLQTKELKRNLYLKTTHLYSAIFALQQKELALKKAKDAINQAYAKAKALFEKGLLAPSELYNIEAKKYAITAQITDTDNKISSLYNTLSFLLNSQVKKIDTLYPLPLPKKDAILKASKTRADILALKKALRIDEMDIKLAKSSYYPKIALIAALKRHGDSLRLNGDGFTNADKSFVGAVMRWNLFNGLSDKHTLEAAKIKKVATLIVLQEYKTKITTNIDNAFLTLQALLQRLKSAKAEIKARQEYYRLTLGRFENQLASADELSRSIADLATAKAKKAAIKAAIFNQKAKIYLLGGLKSFKKIVQ